VSGADSAFAPLTGVLGGLFAWWRSPGGDRGRAGACLAGWWGSGAVGAPRR